MKIIWLKGGVIDADGGFFHIKQTVRPVLARTGDIIILERGCITGGRAVAHAAKNQISLFITDSGATKVHSWLPACPSPARLAQQIIASQTPHVVNEVSRWMLWKRFGRVLHPAHGVHVARGCEGAIIRQLYRRMATEHQIAWPGRQRGVTWKHLAPLNRAISLGNAAFYGLTQIAVLHTGYSPWYGFMHGTSGKSLVYDIADFVKFDRILPLAFRFAADGRPHPEWRTRAACIRLFRKNHLLRELITLTERTMDVALHALAGKSFQRRHLPLS